MKTLTDQLANYAATTVTRATLPATSSRHSDDRAGRGGAAVAPAMGVAGGTGTDARAAGDPGHRAVLLAAGPALQLPSWGC